MTLRPSRRPLCLAGVLLALVALAASSALGAAPAPASAAASYPRSVVLVFLPATIPKYPDPNLPKVLDRLDAHRQLALGLIGATQGPYSQQQTLLDLTQGTRVSLTTYKPSDPPILTFVRVRGSGVIYGWYSAIKRAGTAPATLHPGLLSDSVPGGAGFVGVLGVSHLEAVAAAGSDGLVPAVSLGQARSLPQRTQTMLTRHRLAVVGLPTGDPGIAALDGILAQRAPGELVIVVQTPPYARQPQLLPAGIVGDGSGGALTSETTHRQGVVAAIDILPTILHHLGVRVPASVRGQPIRTQGARDPGGLRDLSKRLSVIGARRIPALQGFLFGWLIVLLACGVVRDRRGVMAGMRLGGLALTWLPTTLLITAAFSPSRGVELMVLAAGSFALAAITDRLVGWPRGLLVPAAVGLAAYGVDLVRDSQLIVRSLLGPNPRSGSRFYGIGNELEIGLTVLYLVGVGAALPWRGRTRRGAAAFALVGLVVAAVMASDRLGADVGGIFTVGFGAAVATLMLLPRGISWRAVVVAVLAPVAGLAVLAGVDLLFGGSGHFTRTILHSGGLGDLENTAWRRYELAFDLLRTGYIPYITLICALAAAYAIRHRDRVYAAVGPDAVWRAALGGGLAASLAGALFNDSGPMLFLIGVVALAGVTAYLRARPPSAPAPEAGAPPPASAKGAPLAPSREGAPVAPV